MEGTMLTAGQVDFIKKGNFTYDIELKGTEIMAIYVLGQMQDRIVELTDTMWDKTKIGLFHINEINGVKDPDFSNPDDWQKVELKSISFSLFEPTDWGITTDTYQDIFIIGNIKRVKQ